MAKKPIASRIEGYRDFDLRFIANPNTGDIAMKKDIAAVKQSVLNILMTNHGEKVFRPNFGGNLRAYLFENFDDIQKTIIEDIIETTLVTYEPRVKVNYVDVEDLSYRNALNISLEVTIQSTTEINTTIDFVVERVR